MRSSFTLLFLAVFSSLHQNDQRARLQVIAYPKSIGISGTQATFSRCIHPSDPAARGTKCWQSKLHILVVSIQENKKIFITDFPAALIGLIKSLTGEKHAEAMNRRVAPLFFIHLMTGGIEPENIFYISALDRAPLKKMPAVENRMALAQVNHALNERE